MRILFSIWRLSIRIAIWDFFYEMAALYYLSISLRCGGHHTIVELYRPTRNRIGLLFHIELPFFDISNDTYQEAVGTGTEGQCRVVPVTTGKIFGRRIGGLPKGVLQK